MIEGIILAVSGLLGVVGQSTLGWIGVLVVGLYLVAKGTGII